MFVVIYKESLNWNIDAPASLICDVFFICLFTLSHGFLMSILLLSTVDSILIATEYQSA